MNPDMNSFSRSLDSGFLTEVDVILWVRMVKSCGMDWMSGTNLIAFLCTMQYCTEQGKKQYIEPDFMMTYIGNRSILFLQITKIIFINFINCFKF